MGEHVSDKQHLPVEVNRGYHAELVAANVENVEVADAVGGIRDCLELCEVREPVGFDDLAPRLQRPAGCAMRPGKVRERLVRYDSQRVISIRDSNDRISHPAIFASPPAIELTNFFLRPR